MLYFELATPKLEDNSAVWNSSIYIEVRQLVRTHRKFFLFLSSVLQSLRIYLTQRCKSGLPEISYLKWSKEKYNGFLKLMFKMDQNSALTFWEVSAFVWRLEISEILNCCMLILSGAAALPPVALRQQMVSVGILVQCKYCMD